MKLHKNHKIKLIILSVILILSSAALTIYLLSQSKSKTETSRPEKLVTETKKLERPAEKSLKFAAMGDMLAHDSVVNQVKSGSSYDFSPYFAKIKPLYEGGDVVFCNPETPAAGAQFGISGYPTFNAPLEFSRDLSKNGCNLINFATNHIADKGQAALSATLDEWERLRPLAMSGANRSPEEQQKVPIFEKNGLKVAFLAFADFSNAKAPHSYSVNFYHDKELVKSLMTKARQNADVVVVSAHWGVEDSHAISVDQSSAAQMLADLGADVIIGTGPHVLQPVKWLERADGGKTLVWYSIGNMLSSQLKIEELTGGVAKFKITKQNDELKFSDISFIGTFMSYEWSAADRAASNLAARRNLKLQPLADAEAETKLFGVSVDERAQKIRQWLGRGVEMTIQP